jgi:sodium-coupled monocarboxylate transporter 8/12
MKAVVWTDFLQGIVMVVSSVAVIVVGTVHVGGFGELWDRSSHGGRIRVFE